MNTVLYVFQRSKSFKKYPYHLWITDSTPFIKLKKQKNTSHNFMTNESQLKIKKAMVERIEQGLWICMELNSYPWGKITWF